MSTADAKRPCVSGMNCFAGLGLHVVLSEMGNMSGAYRYVPAKHSLELLVPAKPGARLLAGSTQQAQVDSAPAIFIISAVYARMGSGAKSRTWTDYEAGLASENLLLEAVARGLGAVITGGIDPASVKEAVKLTGGEEVIVIIPVGYPAK